MPIFKDRDGAFVTTNAFVDRATTCEKRYQDDYPSDEDDEHASKLSHHHPISHKTNNQQQSGKRPLPPQPAISLPL